MENDRYVDFFGISTFFQGALIFLALFLWCSSRGKRSYGYATGGSLTMQRWREDTPKDPDEPKDPWDQAISRPLADHHWGDGCGGLGGLGGMTQREQEELLLFCGTQVAAEGHQATP